MLSKRPWLLVSVPSNSLELYMNIIKVSLSSLMWLASYYFLSFSISFHHFMNITNISC